LIEQQIGEGLILDVGGWANPWNRADYVLDSGPYETRKLGYHGVGKLPKGTFFLDPLPGERFTKKTWVVHDACSDQPFPFPDKMFDFAVCSHTLEDVQNPVRICQELARVAKAGYLETPSRLAEQTVSSDSRNLVGFVHHFWMVEMGVLPR
jgi:SAM-dependent methyltransferase